MSSEDQWVNSLIQDLIQSNPTVDERISSQFLTLLKDDFRNHQLTKKELNELAENLIDEITNTNDRTSKHEN